MVFLIQLEFNKHFYSKMATTLSSRYFFPFFSLLFPPIPFFQEILFSPPFLTNLSFLLGLAPQGVGILTLQIGLGQLLGRKGHMICQIRQIVMK